MSKSPRRKTFPVSIRFTQAERAWLTNRANGVTLGTYVRHCVLADHIAPLIPLRRAPVKDAEPLGQLLGLLGQSRLANNLNQLAKAANLGALPVTEETEAELRQACAAVQEMRLLLLQALGIKILEGVTSNRSVGKAFAQAGGEEP